MKQFHGFSLFEIMIAIAISAMVLVPVSRVLRFQLRSIYSDYWQSKAVVLANILFENSIYKSTQTWSQLVERELPRGKSNIQCHQQICTATVTWFNHGNKRFSLSGII